MDVNAFGSILGAADSDHVALLQPPPFPDPEPVVVQHECGVHPGLAWHPPRTLDADVGRKIGGGEEILRQHAIRRRRNERGVGSVGELWFGEIGMSECRHGLKISVRPIGYSQTDFEKTREDYLLGAVSGPAGGY